MQNKRIKTCFIRFIFAFIRFEPHIAAHPSSDGLASKDTISSVVYNYSTYVYVHLQGIRGGGDISAWLVVLIAYILYAFPFTTVCTSDFPLLKNNCAIFYCVVGRFCILRAHTYMYCSFNILATKSTWFLKTGGDNMYFRDVQAKTFI